MTAPQAAVDVPALLDALYDSYDGFDVSQTTVSVGAEEFAAFADRGDVVEVRVRVEGSEGLLGVPGDGRVPAGGDDGSREVATDGADGDGPLPRAERWQDGGNDTDGDWRTPGGIVDGRNSLASAAEVLVHDQTGVDCRVEDLLRVSLVSVQCEETGDEVWELTALFAGRPEMGAPRRGAAWCEQLAEPLSPF